IQERTPSGLVWNWNVIRSFLMVMIPPQISMLIMFSCGFSIISRCRFISPSSTQIHTQLLKALMVQAAIPVLFIFVPLGLQFIMPLVGSSFGRAGMATSTFTSFFPVIDPLVVISFIPLYRNNLRKWCNPAFIYRVR
ncbi:hypothetical protein PFISCL1PPCAC_18792, partial [Pristionchus fissidentatus]